MANLVGRVILNRYGVRTFLGRGGMAEVYHVWDNQRMSFLAMKVLHEDLALDKIFIRRFAREANNLAHLQHPNIVRFYGFERQGRLAYMLMEYIEGETLKHLIYDSEKALPLDQLHVVMQGVCGALHYAHNMGVVHCDIKPANIMIDRSGSAQLADFGIARMTDTATATLVGVGTPAYMAPEQIRGEDPTPQTDIYALGIVLYEMLTGGERPFTGEHAQITGGTGEKVRWEHLHLSPPSPKTWNPDLSPKLEHLVLRALEKDPTKRYPDVLAFRNDLELALSGKISEGKGTRQLQERIAKNLGGSDTGQAASAQQTVQEGFPQPVWRQYRNFFIAVFSVIILLTGSILFSRRSSNRPFPTPISSYPIEPQVLPEPTSTPFEDNPVTEEIPPTDMPTIKPSDTPAPKPTSTIPPTPLPRLSVDFVDTRYVMDYVNDPDVPPIGGLADEQYTWDERSRSNITLPFTIRMKSSQDVFWRWFWCATTKDILDSNMADFTPEFWINDEKVSLSNFVEIGFTHEGNGQKCAGLAAALTNWEPGKYKLVQRISYDNEIYDGIDVYEPGSRTLIYSITVE